MYTNLIQSLTRRFGYNADVPANLVLRHISITCNISNAEAYELLTECTKCGIFEYDGSNVRIKRSALDYYT